MYDSATATLFADLLQEVIMSENHLRSCHSIKRVSFVLASNS